MTDKNNINKENKENTEKVGFMGKVKNFVKDHKIPTVITALVLVLAIGTGVVFGITKSSSNVGEFPTFSSDETGSDIDVPPIEPDDETSSETDSTESDGTVSTVVTQTPTPDKSTSSTVSTKEPSTSTPQYPTSSGATTSTPTTTTPTTSTPSTSTPSTPSSPSETPSTPSTTPSTPSDSTSDDAGLEGKDWFYKTYIDGTTGEEVQCRAYYVTIGQRQFLVNYDAVYGICKKCGLNNQTIHSPVTCPHCSKTICAAAYVNTTTDIFTCPYCLTEIDDNTFIELLS